MLEASLGDAGVQMHIVRSRDVPSGVAFVCLSDSAENAITVAPGANEKLAPEHLPSLSGVSHLLMQLETPIASITAYAKKARAAGVQAACREPACTASLNRPGKHPTTRTACAKYASYCTRRPI